MGAENIKSVTYTKSMKHRKGRIDSTIVTILSLIVFLLVAIGVTLYFQVQTVYEIPASPPTADDYLPEKQTNQPSSEAEVVDIDIEPYVDTSLPRYVEVVDSCGPHFEGECLRVRSGPGLDYPVVSQLRTGIVLKVATTVEQDGLQWYKITFDEWLRYPERYSGSWYVAADYVKVLYDEGTKTVWDEESAAATQKKIIVERSTQMLYAYDGEELFMEQSISTGIELTPTPRGIFTIFKKTPSRYMQGPLDYLAMSKYYDLPGVPWNLYFTEQGAVIHGAYWHNSFGKKYSSGCVNVHPLEARKLYEWADLGTTVIVRD